MSFTSAARAEAQQDAVNVGAGLMNDTAIEAAVEAIKVSEPQRALLLALAPAQR